MWASGCEYCLATDSPLFSVIAPMGEDEEGTKMEGMVVVVLVGGELHTGGSGSLLNITTLSFQTPHYIH